MQKLNCSVSIEAMHYMSLHAAHIVHAFNTYGRPPPDYALALCEVRFSEECRNQQKL